MTSAVTIAFDYRPSRWLAAAGAAITVLAAIAIMLAALPWAVRGPLALVALALGARSLRRFLRTPVDRVALGESGWLVYRNHDDGQPATLRAHARIGPLQSIEFERADGLRIALVLTPDNLDRETRRRLHLVLARGDFLHAS
jgi:hypothetical protein